MAPPHRNPTPLGSGLSLPLGTALSALLLTGFLPSCSLTAPPEGPTFLRVENATGWAIHDLLIHVKPLIEVPFLDGSDPGFSVFYEGPFGPGPPDARRALSIVARQKADATVRRVPTEHDVPSGRRSGAGA
jgi:hypothetical protein